MAADSQLSPTGGPGSDTSTCARFITAQSGDLDHYRAQPGNWNVQITQLGKGRFHSRTSALEFPDLVIYQNQWNCASLVHGQSPTGWHMFGGVVAPEQAGFTWCGLSADRRRLACTREQGEIEFSMDNGARSLVVLVKPEVLQQTTGAQATERLSRARHLNTNGAGTHLVDQALHLLQSFEVHPELLDEPAIATQARGVILTALENCLQNHTPENLYMRCRTEAVELAKAHVRLTGGQTTAWDMARAAGVSQKSLETGFREALGMTPGRYLMTYRLNGAHHQLADASKHSDSVTATALRWGFSHMGRFSRAYRQLFGESPSQTLARDKGSH